MDYFVIFLRRLANILDFCTACLEGLTDKCCNCLFLSNVSKGSTLKIHLLSNSCQGSYLISQFYYTFSVKRSSFRSRCYTSHSLLYTFIELKYKQLFTSKYFFTNLDWLEFASLLNVYYLQYWVCMMSG